MEHSKSGKSIRGWAQADHRRCRPRFRGMEGGMTRTGGARNAWLCAPALAFALLGADSARSQSLYNTLHVVEHSGNACLRQDDCRTHGSEARSVEAGQSVAVAFQCPADHPYLRNWDATRHEHVSLSVSPSHIGKGPLTLIVRNQADVTGYFVVLPGCAKKPAGVPSLIESLGSNPTNVAIVRRAQR